MRQLTELEVTLQQLTAEYNRLMKHMDAHQAAMKSFDLPAMDGAAHQQEASRLRIGMLENKRKTLVNQIGKLLKHDGQLTIQRIDVMNPPRVPRLMKPRDELKSTDQQTRAKKNIIGNSAGAVVVHLITVDSINTSSVDNFSVYSK